MIRTCRNCGQKNRIRPANLADRVRCGACKTALDPVAEPIEADAATQREATGRKPLGAEAILRQDPRTEPNRTKKSPAPLFHTTSRRAYLGDCARRTAVSSPPSGMRQRS